MAKDNVLEFIRGTTPTIIIEVEDEIDLSYVAQVWIYIYQNKQLKVDKMIEDVQFDYEHNLITLRLSQDDTLNCKAGEAKFQIRLLMDNTEALATIGSDVVIYEVYKDGVIKNE